MDHLVQLAYLVQFGFSANMDLAHLVQVTLEVGRRYSETVVQKVPVVHLVQFGPNCSVGGADSKYRVAAIFPLPVWPIELPEACLWHLLAYSDAVPPIGARKSDLEVQGPFGTVGLLSTVRFLCTYGLGPLSTEHSEGPRMVQIGLWSTLYTWSP